MPDNLVTTVQSRFSVIQPALLPTMQTLEVIDTESLINTRMSQLVAFWAANDPPNAAAYDVGNLEFDPIRINQELNAYAELMVRDRVNQNTRAVTLAFAVGGDLDAIGSRYPYGMPRMAGENDQQYKQRIWLSPNILSLNGPGQGTYESYVFWAMSAPMTPPDVQLQHASALTLPGTGKIYIPILPLPAWNTKWTVSPDGGTWTLAPGANPIPTSTQISTVYQYINAAGIARKGLTDYINVIAPKVAPVNIVVQITLFPGVDMQTLMGEIADAVLGLVQAIYWLGAGFTILSLQGAFAQSGVFNTDITSGSDQIIGMDTVVNIQNITLIYIGTGS
jgi:phage-related baseplate assembly protein